MPAGADEGNDAQGAKSVDLQSEIRKAVEEETANIKAHRDKVMEENKRILRRVQEIEDPDYRDHVEEYRRLKTEASKRAEEKAKAEGDFESLKKQMIDNHKTELEKRDMQIKALTGALEGELIDSKALAAIGKHTPNVDLLLPHVRTNLSVVGDDGKFRAIVRGTDGKERLMQDPKNPSALIPMDIETYVLSLKQQFPAAFPGTGGTGSGTAANQDVDAGGVKTIPDGDNEAFLANVEAIAAGKVKVV